MKREILKKSIAFRVCSVIIMALFFYIVTGSLKEMTFFTVLVEAIKTVQYAVFELAWKKYKGYVESKKRFQK